MGLDTVFVSSLDSAYGLVTMVWSRDTAGDQSGSEVSTTSLSGGDHRARVDPRDCGGT